MPLTDPQQAVGEGKGPERGKEVAGRREPPCPAGGRSEGARGEAGSADAVEKLLCAAFHVEPCILLGLVAGQPRDALDEVKD